jgi:hypothetical protein
VQSVFGPTGLQYPIPLHVTAVEPWFGQPLLVHTPCAGTQTLKPDVGYALHTYGLMQFDAFGLHES